ncbi:MAG: hypothetical protein WC894_00930 [Patescibacteria group bacterium]
MLEQKPPSTFWPEMKGLLKRTGRLVGVLGLFALTVLIIYPDDESTSRLDSSSTPKPPVGFIGPTLTSTPDAITAKIVCETYKPEFGRDINTIWRKLGRPDVLTINMGNDDLIINMNRDGNSNLSLPSGVDICIGE